MKRFTQTVADVASQIAVTVAASLCAGGAALAADDNRASTMNQSSVYEQSMAFYLHPAHGFPGVASNNAQHPAVVIKRQGADPMFAFQGRIVGHAAIGASRGSAYSETPVVAQRRSAQPSAALLSHPAAAPLQRTALARSE